MVTGQQFCCLLNIQRQLMFERQREAGMRKDFSLDWNPSTCEVEAGRSRVQGYIQISRPAWATWDPIKRIKAKEPKQQNNKLDWICEGKQAKERKKSRMHVCCRFSQTESFQNHFPQILEVELTLLCPLPLLLMSSDSDAAGWGGCACL